jgi:diguanylate cyclase (GGDEF)-like protein
VTHPPTPDMPPPDLSACAREPIHTPGAIQPHGVLIATDADSHRIGWVSANIELSLGVAPEQALGLDLDQVLGADAWAAVEAAIDGEINTLSKLLFLTLPIAREPERTALVHRHLGRIIVELEHAPTRDGQGMALSRMQTMIASLQQSETVGQLCDEAVRQIRLLTGYDRVMVYRFDPDGHGQVVAEDKAPELAPYLNLRYPGSDIPEQARRLYLLKRLRYIHDVGYVAVPMLAASRHAGSPEPKLDELDMSYCATRAVSPIHLEYLRNMGVSATLALSLIQDDRLWGMVVCHHRQALTVPAETRIFCDVVSQLMSVLLRKVATAEGLAGQIEDQRIIAELTEAIASAGSVTDGLCHRADALLGLVQADGAWVTCDGKTSLLGRTPPEPAITAMLADIRRRQGDVLCALSDAGTTDGPAAAHPAVASGILVMPITNKPGDGIAWFRSEVIHTVDWAGDPHKPVEVSGDSIRMSPRKSFEAWTELVRGQSIPWTAANLRAAQELARAVTASLLRQADVRLAQLASLDPLTGLANRRAIDAQLGRWRDGDSGTTAALLLLDFDRFKTINDSLGHIAGDDVLVQFAVRLREAAPAGSMTGRLGGDEFVLFWPGATAAAAERVAAELVHTFAQPFLLQGQSHHASTSIGVAWAASASSQDLMREADVAMYAAKRQGGSRAVMFQPELYASALSTMRIEQDLFRALERDEFEIYYQPLVTVADRAVCGVEALIRWNHPVHGWIAPSAFIATAEESWLITRIGAWVLAGAIRQAAEWSREFPALTISVNVSPRQLMDGSLTTLVLTAMERDPVGVNSIAIEVTEGVLMRERAVQELHRIRALNVHVSVDDFGTGYSSLAYLRGLPVDTVKIDRSFVTALGSNARADRLFKAIVDLAHTLGLHTVAEGCETEEQWRVIAASGCERVQGWLIAKAMPAAETYAFLKAHRSAI